MITELKYYIYLIKFTSGHIVRTWSCDTQINEVAERLRNSYSKYFNVQHQIEQVVCEK